MYKRSYKAKAANWGIKYTKEWSEGRKNTKNEVLTLKTDLGWGFPPSSSSGKTFIGYKQLKQNFSRLSVRPE